MKRQSATFWFQPASIESGHTASLSAGSIGVIDRTSVLAIAHLVVRRLVERGHVARQPVRRPFDHRAERHLGLPELLDHAAGIVDPAGRRGLPTEGRRLAEELAEFAGEPADLDR